MAPEEGPLHEVRSRLLSGPANVVRCPAATGQALALFGAHLAETSVFWERDDASDQPTTVVGIGAAVLLRAQGGDRFGAVVAGQKAAFSGLHLEPGSEEVVRFFGGSAFSTGRDGSGCWEDFGDSTFVLPRILYVERPGSAEFVIVDAPGASGGTERTLALFAQALSVLSSRPSPPPALHVEARAESAGALEYERLVAEAQARIEAGSVQKVALARRITLTLSAAPRAEHLLERMRTTAVGSTRFALRIGERTFVGATPETLVRLRGLDVETEALAGTAPVGSQATALGAKAGEGLLSSAKDRAEHRFVVDALRQALAPLCDALDIEAEPRVRTLPHLLHLCTPVVGRLKAPCHVLDLVERLHPTPAVCGSPTAEAFRFIVEHEAAPRGWYAAPFGWINRAGDGHFVVGLRSALVHGRKVHLYAGAGIVRASEPRLEYEETELKLESIRSALGLTGGSTSPASPT